MYAKGDDPDTVAGEFGRRPLYKMLGYFSLVGLLRLHSLLGDFYQAVKVLENMELNKKVDAKFKKISALLLNVIHQSHFRRCTREYLPAKYQLITMLGLLI